MAAGRSASRRRRWFASARPRGCAASASAEPLAILAAVNGPRRSHRRRGRAPPCAPPSGARSSAAIASRAPPAAPPRSSSTTATSSSSPRRARSPSAGGRAPGRSRAGPPGSRATSTPASRFVTGGSRETGLVALSALRGAADASPLLLEPRKTELLDAAPLVPLARRRGSDALPPGRLRRPGRAVEPRGRGHGLRLPGRRVRRSPPGSDFLWEVRALSEQGELRREESYVHVLAAERGEGRARLARPHRRERRGSRKPGRALPFGLLPHRPRPVPRRGRAVRGPEPSFPRLTGPARSAGQRLPRRRPDGPRRGRVPAGAHAHR